MVGWLLNLIEQGDLTSKLFITIIITMITIIIVNIIFLISYYRSQTLNQADALEKLRNAIRLATEPDKPAPTAEELEKFRKQRISKR